VKFVVVVKNHGNKKVQDVHVTAQVVHRFGVVVVLHMDREQNVITVKKSTKKCV